ncbi:MAG: ATP synthase F1 subunit delta [Planctomycetes bacterium]|nr:ATP synthase F1 subunit delta [Planctomycetota bacterium]
MATNPSDPVARMYAVALYETARDKGAIGEVHDGMQRVFNAYQDKTFRDFFTSPRVPRAVKMKGMDEALKSHVSEAVLNFIKVLILKGREPQFDNICQAFDMYRDQAENREHAWVESGTEFNPGELEELKKQLSVASGGKEIVLHFNHKEELLGGARVRLGDKLVDNTLRTRLTHLAMALEK